MGKDLRQFLQVVKRLGANYYVEVNRLLKPKYEVPVLQHKLAKKGCFPVVYCSKIEGSKLPLVTNLFASYEMLGVALGITPERMKLGQDVILKEYRGRQEEIKPTKQVPAAEAPVREIIIQGKDVNLERLPIIHHAELNPGPYVTIGMTVSKDPDTGIPNVGIYRMELKGKDRIACMMIPNHHGGKIGQRYAELGKPMEVVTFLGHHPAVAMAVAAGRPLKMDENEFELVGALLGEPLEVTQAVTVDLPVPAHAEIAIEGIIDPTKMGTEGPFSEGAGYYGEERPCYIIQVTAITMRRDAIYHDLYPIHQEHNLVGQLGREANIYDAVKRAVPNVKAVHVGPDRQCGKLLIYVSLKKQAEEETKQAGLAALSSDEGGRMAVVVDEDIDVYDESEVWWAIATRMRGDLDISVHPGSMLTKTLIDATIPLDKPFPRRVTPPKDTWDSMKLEDYL
ncbi:MAG TPA: UbiD family decarboxylase [Dehalococcoidia bacterium]|nr:UbiD family decarboxylase [Dehalococcoidia bacterium]